MVKTPSLEHRSSARDLRAQVYRSRAAILRCEPRMQGSPARPGRRSRLCIATRVHIESRPLTGTDCVDRERRSPRGQERYRSGHNGTDSKSVEGIASLRGFDKTARTAVLHSFAARRARYRMYRVPSHPHDRHQAQGLISIVASSLTTNLKTMTLDFTERPI